jgi:hypothetical protein
VADPGADRHSTRLAHDLGYRLGHDEVVDDLLPRVVGQNATGDQRGDRAPRERLPGVVEEERTVGVPVEGDPQVEAASPDQILQVGEIFWNERVGRMIGERAVGLEVEPGEACHDPIEDLLDGNPRHPVAAVDGDPQRTDRFGGDDREKVIDVTGDRIHPPDLALMVGDERGARLDVGSDLDEPGVRADRRRAGTAQFDPVVDRRIVRRRDNRARHVLGAREVVHRVGGDLAEIDHIGPGTGDPAGHRLEETTGGGPAVPPDRAHPSSGQLDQT